MQMKWYILNQTKQLLHLLIFSFEKFNFLNLKEDIHIITGKYGHEYDVECTATGAY